MAGVDEAVGGVVENLCPLDDGKTAGADDGKVEGGSRVLIHLERHHPITLVGCGKRSRPHQVEFRSISPARTGVVVGSEP
ncbi:hypothetical protein GCM10023113_20920 [Cellulomonas oligotrophica]|uniref:Uncharacterized protein n=1 Tax=Cellulomonas oligotrophica TaxID=931536 RepID=A0ABQ4DEX0_9CELL|nr:hypothetical protein Col01nite_34280 [Cellulomonas oligotrophica]